MWQFLLINRDIRAKLRNRPTELQQWEQIVMNELRKAVCMDDG
jgi:hypothetical protein